MRTSEKIWKELYSIYELNIKAGIETKVSITFNDGTVMSGTINSCDPITNNQHGWILTDSNGNKKSFNHTDVDSIQIYSKIY